MAMPFRKRAPPGLGNGELRWPESGAAGICPSAGLSGLRHTAVQERRAGPLVGIAGGRIGRGMHRGWAWPSGTLLD